MLILKLPLYLPHTLDLRIKMWGFFFGGALIPSPSPAPGVRGRRELANIIPSPVRNERERVKARVLFPLP